MFDSDNPLVYEKVYEELKTRLAVIDLCHAAEGLGLKHTDGEVEVPCLGRLYHVGRDGVKAAYKGEAAFTHRIVIAYYLLHGGRGINAGRFIPYRELPGGQDFARSLSQIVEDRLAQHFSGRLEALVRSARALAARPAETEMRADAAFVFDALPKLPLMLTFFDADEDFPAEVKVFYDLTAPNFLDLECLAVLGLILALELEEAGKEAK